MRRVPTNLQTYKPTRKPLEILFVLTLFFTTVSRAETICSSAAQNLALVVIDMQPKFVTRGGNDKTPENVAKVKQITDEQIAAINWAKQANIPIVFLEYDGDYGDYGDTNSDLKAAVANYKELKFFKKTSDGMFESYNKYRKDLVDYLAKKQVGTLIITGANGGACVLMSIKGALDSDCTVVAYTKGIADFNYKDFIYPYVGKYSDLKPNCPNCSFKEISSLEGLGQYMVNRPSNVVRPAQNSGAAQ